MGKIFFPRQRNKQASRDILGEPRYFIRKLRDIQLADIGKHKVYEIGTGGGRSAFSRTCDPAGKNRFVEVDHFHDFLFDVVHLLRSLVPRDSLCRANKDVADPAFAPSVALPVVARKTLDEGTRELDLSAHEDPFPGNKDIVKDDKRFLPSELAVSNVNLAALESSCIA